MNLNGNSATPGYAENAFLCAYVPVLSSKMTAFFDEEDIEFSTIDGDVVTFDAGSDAVSSGSGIFIGDYFVGITENYTSQQVPFVRY
jgi:hypothetical protein